MQYNLYYLTEYALVKKSHNQLMEHMTCLIQVTHTVLLYKQEVHLHLQVQVHLHLHLQVQVHLHFTWFVE